MLHNLWRSAHFLLAAIASVFILLATLSGIVLSLEPLYLRYSNHHENLDKVVLADLIPQLQNQYDELLSLDVDAHERILLSTFSMDPDLPGDFYIHPKEGTYLAPIEDQSEIFAWATNFHRSLFLKTPGRIFVGITAFLLLLITITGFALLVKRLGWSRFFHPFIKTDTASYYHSYLGRLHVFPIAIIAVSGVVLSLQRFSLLPQETTVQNMAVETAERQPVHEFPVFKTTPLAEVRSLEFPFSDDPEDPYILTTTEATYEIHQYHGTILRKELFPFTEALTALSFSWHTGAGSYWWGIVLLSASLSMLYFLYSGLIMAYKRLSGGFSNSVDPNAAEIVVLVGSEHGKTQQYANAFTQALLQKNRSAYKTHLNAIDVFPKMKQLVVFTATYGDGEAPANAHHFLTRLPQFLPKQPVGFSVVGFGSRLYPKFCQYAKDVQHALVNLPMFNPMVAPTYIDGAKSYEFQDWLRNWGVKNNLQLQVNIKDAEPEKQKELALSVLAKAVAHDGTTETFVLRLKAIEKVKIQSGDLLGIVPEPGATPRQYSVGKDAKGNILLAIRKHEHGLCSSFLLQQKPGFFIAASLLRNKAFYIPRKGRVFLIANGTGIAPFLGMMHENTKATISLLWGVRKKAVYQLVAQEIEQAISSHKLSNFSIAYSKEPEGERYVQNIIEQRPQYYAKQLEQGAVFMLCGSLTMRDGVLTVLTQIAEQYLDQPLAYYQNRGQILSDCY